MKKIHKIHIRSYFRRDGTKVRAHSRAIARRFHMTRDYQERMKDDARKEPLTKSVDKWILSPNKYDMKNIDTPMPDEYEYDIIDKYGRINKKIRNIDINIVEKRTKDGRRYKRRVAHMRLEKGKRGFYAVDVYVHRDYRNQGLSSYLLRQACNEADARNEKLILDAAPFEERSSDFRKRFPRGEKSKKWREHQLILAEYYRSFGFDYKKFSTGVRRTIRMERESV